MSSTQTTNILEGVLDRLGKYVLEGGSYTIAEIEKALKVCTLHYEAWEQSYRIETNSLQYAYSNLPAETKKMDVQVKWYFKLLRAFVTVTNNE
jgi:hypothetical protein